MALEVVWTSSAERDRKSILKYWIKANGTSGYSRKLHASFEEAIQQVLENPYIGRPTDLDGIRVKLVGVYHIFYRLSASSLYIVRVIDGRRDLRKLKF